VAGDAHGKKRSVDIWPMEDVTAETTFEGMDTVRCLSFSPDGQRLAAAGDHAEGIIIIDVGTRGHRRSLNSQDSDIECLGFSPKGQFIACGYENGIAEVWETCTGRKRHLLTGHGQRTSCVAFSPDEKVLATGSDDGTARLWSTSTGQELLKLDHP